MDVRGSCLIIPISRFARRYRTCDFGGNLLSIVPGKSYQDDTVLSVIRRKPSGRFEARRDAWDGHAAPCQTNVPEGGLPRSCHLVLTESVPAQRCRARADRF